MKPLQHFRMRPPLYQGQAGLHRLSLGVLLASFCLSGCMFSGGIKSALPPSSADAPDPSGLNVQLIPLTAQTLPPVKQKIISPEVLRLLSQAAPAYRLAVGDQLQISAWALNELNSASAPTTVPYTIYSDGNVRVPMAGSVRAAGKTVSEFRRDLERALSRYIKKPDVQVQVAKYQGRSFFVGGEVVRQGEYPLMDQSISLYQAIGLAGGFGPGADRQRIALMRNQRLYDLDLNLLEKSGQSAHRIYMQQGDTLHVLSREDKKAYVMGEVGQTVAVSIPEQRLSLTQLIAESQGINPSTANPAKVYVLRDQSQDAAKLYQLDLSNFANMTLANRFLIEPNDVVYIDATGLARWNRVLSMLLPSASGVGAVQAISRGN